MERLVTSKKYLYLLVGILSFIGLYLTSIHNYLVFHSIAEIFSTIVAFSIFIIAWNSRRFIDNHYLLFIGIAYLFVGGMDLIHALAYKGMGIFEENEANLATQLWIASRYVQSLSLFIAPFFFRRKLKIGFVFTGYVLAISLLLISIFYWNIFPVCFIEGVGLTLFKKISEYIISLILLASIVLLLRNRGEFDRGVLQLLVGSIALTIVSELAFTFYIHVYGFSNLVGHFFKILAFYFIYKAIIETGLNQPYNLLFRNLKKSEETLTRENDFTSAVLSTAGALVVVLDREGRILRFNKACEKLTGYSFEEVRGRYFWDLFLILEEVEPVKAVFEELRSGQFPNEHENYWTGKDGRRHLIMWSNTALLGHDGSVEHVIATGIDITERKRAEEALHRALKESHQRQTEISALLEGSRDVLEYHEFRDAARSVFDSCKNLIGAAAGYIALLSLDEIQNEVLFLDSGGLPCTVDPNLPMPIRGLREEAYRTGKAVYHNDFYKSEHFQFMPEGHAPLENVLFAPLVIRGKTLGLLGLANKPGGFTENDVRMASAFGDLAAVALHNNRTLEALENSEERFRSAAETASDAIISIDKRGTITFWNNSAEIVFGYSTDKMIGKPLTFIMPERFREPHQKGLNQAASMGKSKMIGKSFEMVGLRKDGSEFPIELSLATWKTREGIFFTGIIRDITERKQTEKALRKAHDELEQRVEERTAELMIANEQLKQEMEERKRAEEEKARQHRRLEALWKITRKIDADYKTLYDMVLVEIVEMTQSRYGFYGFINEDESVMTIHSWSNEAMEDCKIRDKPIKFPIAEAGLWGEAVRKRKILIVNDYKGDHPGKKGIPEGHVSLTRILVVPAFSHGRIIALAAVTDKPTDYTEEDAEQINAFITHLQVILERRQAEEALRESENRLRLLSSQLLTAEENERKRITREIHDGIGQMLTTIKFRSESMLQEMGNSGVKKWAKPLEAIISTIQESIEESRRIQMNLRPSILDDLGILATISWFCREFQTTYSSIHIEKQIDIKEDEVPESLKTLIYRILQEGLNNIGKHSKANTVSLSLKRKDNRIELTIEDNGQGFDLEERLSVESSKRGMGLGSMRERTELSGGSFEIESTIGTGTSLKAIWSI